MNYKTTITVIGAKKEFPLCTSNTCCYTRDCANHSTAGDFRKEAGLTPDLKKEGNDWFCSKAPKKEDGAILVNGSLLES